MPDVLEIVRAVYEVSTVVTDVLLNHEYIQRGWKEEYALSIAFLVFNGLVMAVVGLQLEAKDPRKRYVNIAWLNSLIGGLIGLLQLRVLVETVYTYVVSVQAGKNTASDKPTGDESSRQLELQEESPQQREKRLEEGLVYVAFVQAMVRDVPLFVIQANATIHYRKWKLVDLWAVVSTGLTLLYAVSSYAKAKPHGGHAKTASYPKILGWTATLFLFGQFVFRLGAILLVATTTGYAVVVYSMVVVAISIAFTIAMRLATPVQATSAQVSLAVLFFPLFSVFTVDAAHLGPVVGDVKLALYSTKLLVLNAWRVLENAIGVALAVALPRYTDFGVSTDREIALIGVACGAVYVLTLLVFLISVRTTATEVSDSVDDAGSYHRSATSHTA